MAYINPDEATDLGCFQQNTYFGKQEFNPAFYYNPYMAQNPFAAVDSRRALDNANPYNTGFVNPMFAQQTQQTQQTQILPFSQYPANPSFSLNNANNAVVPTMPTLNNAFNNTVNPPQQQHPMLGGFGMPTPPVSMFNYPIEAGIAPLYNGIQGFEKKGNWGEQANTYALPYPNITWGTQNQPCQAGCPYFPMQNQHAQPMNTWQEIAMRNWGR